MDKVIELLRELAQKLGQTVEALWPHAIRYVAVNAAVTLGACLFVAACFALAARRVYQGFLVLADEDKKRGIWRDGTGGLLFGTIACSIIAVLVVAISIGVCLPKVIEPTGALVQQILRR